MPAFDIERREVGVRYVTYRVVADTEEDAIERLHEEEIEPICEGFEIDDATWETEELPDCNCGICRAHGYPWACFDAPVEDIVLDLGERERIWDSELE